MLIKDRLVFGHGDDDGRNYIQRIALIGCNRK